MLACACVETVIDEHVASMASRRRRLARATSDDATRRWRAEEDAAPHDFVHNQQSSPAPRRVQNYRVRRPSPRRTRPSLSRCPLIMLWPIHTLVAPLPSPRLAADGPRPSIHRERGGTCSARVVFSTFDRRPTFVGDARTALQYKTSAAGRVVVKRSPRTAPELDEAPRSSATKLVN